MKIFEEILAVAVRTEDLDSPNFIGETPLYTAILSENLEVIEKLINAGARMENIGTNGQTVLHVAAQYPRLTLVLKYFLDNHDILMSLDREGLLSLVRPVILVGNLPGLELLLEKMEEEKKHELLTFVVEEEYALVHSSANQGYVEMTMLLLRNGGALSLKGEKYTVIHEIHYSRGFFEPLNFFQNLFDEFVSLNTMNRLIDVEYKVLTNGRNQIKVLEDLVKYGYREILNHPLIESLIYVKWKCLLPVFRTIILSYMAFLVLFNIFIITTFIKKDDKKNDTYTMHTENNDTCTCTLYTNDTLQNRTRAIDKTFFVESYGWYPVIYIAIFILLAQECMWLHLQPRRYFKRFESYVTISALVLAAAVPLAVSFAAPAPARHVACAALLLVWLRPLFILSRIPGWGHYVLMLKIVTINIFKIFVMLGCLVIGFAICFMIQKQLEPPFNNIGDTLIKTLVMMSSEFDFKDLFDDTDAFTAVTIRLLFIAFVILIATVIMNLMIGVAVSDANELAAIGNIMALEMQVELLSSLEGVENLIPWKWSRKLCRMQHHDCIFNDGDYNDWTTRDNIYPNDECDYNETLGSKLHNSICKKAGKNPEEDEVLKKNKNILGSLDISTTLEDRVKSLEAIIEVNKELQETKKEVREANEEIVEANKEVQEAKKEVREANKEVQEAKKEVREANKEIVEANKEILAANKDMEKSNNDLKKDVNKILELATSVMRVTRNRKVVSTKLVSRKRKKTGQVLT